MKTKKSHLSDTKLKRMNRGYQFEDKVDGTVSEQV